VALAVVVALRGRRRARRRLDPVFFGRGRNRRSGGGGRWGRGVGAFQERIVGERFFDLVLEVRRRELQDPDRLDDLRREGQLLSGS
jgi:hypothetical protein